MQQPQFFCPNCRSAIQVPAGFTPAGPVQCPTCAQTVNVQMAAQVPFAQKPIASNQSPYGFPATPQQASTGNKTLFWVIGLSVAGIAVLIVGVALVAVVAFALYGDRPLAADGRAGPDNPSATSRFDAGTTDRNSNPATPGKTVPGQADPFGPSIAFDKLPEYRPSLSGMRYHLNTEEPFAIEYKYDAQIQGGHSTLTGKILYRPTSRSPSSVLDDKGELAEGAATGTGFVVRPDGYLITNAHVIQGAVEIEAQLDGKTYPAKVVDMDTKNDLAIIRVNAMDLPHLSISDSNTVRLAEDARAFGYPMTDRLGEGIKITRGTVSGINEQEGTKMFQLDVTVNPGNSGGPLMNDRGQVVGVVTALMAGADIADMSFAVTSNDVRQLLDRNKLKYQLSNPSAAVESGPEMAERVRRSVALLKVTVGAGGVGIAEKKVVEYDLTWSAQNTVAKRNVRVGNKTGTESGVILTDGSGEVVYCDGEKSLPSYLGLLATIGFQPLPNDESKTWHSARVTRIPQSQSVEINSGPSRDFRPLDPFGRRYRRAPRTTTVTRFHPAIEFVKFETSSTSGDVVRIKKTYEMATISEEGTKPFLRVSGKGTFQLDKRKGQPKALDFSGVLAVSAGSQTSQVPLKLVIQSIDTQPLVQAKAERAKRMSEVSKQMKERNELQAAKRKEASLIPIVKGLDKLDLSPK